MGHKAFVACSVALTVYISGEVGVTYMNQRAARKKFEEENDVAELLAAKKAAGAAKDANIKPAQPAQPAKEASFDLDPAAEKARRERLLKTREEQKSF
mmetsp:Transcript_24394/g.34439  ORF Transcript_24394/g.34439 Transcript_24394/m.34439 type:complete len:98 (-) Transcript_24394:108-401(-)